VSGTTIVRAAGGVVWRSDLTFDALPRIVLVHRPRFDDWSLPKGKLTKGEHPLTAAVREIHEETAIKAVPQAGLPSIRYQVSPRNAPAETVAKVVDYWSMRVLSCARRQPDDEVDEVRWVTEEQAGQLLTYPHDQKVVSAFFARPTITGVVCIVRSVEKLAPALALVRPTRLLTATSAGRLRSTVAFAELTGTRVETNPNFDRDADPMTTAEAVLALGRSAAPTVICCRGRLIPLTLAALTNRPAERFRVGRDSGWLLAFTGGQLISATELSPPRNRLELARIGR
jgi:8-oxo-(d)GTP phosphatase